jgi:hypothetical protein
MPNSSKVQEVLAVIQAMTRPERLTLFKQMEAARNLFAGTGYRIGPARKQSGDPDILFKGILVLHAHESSKHVSWKKMPEYMIETYPSLFPRYVGKRLTDTQHERLVELLRQWSRRAKKRLESQH